MTSEDIQKLRVAGYSGFLSDDGLNLKRVNGRCVFLEGDRCRVHELRPKVCRDFPFFHVLGLGVAQSASFCPALEELDR